MAGGTSRLKDFPLVDRKRSTLDEERSKVEEKGLFFFKKKTLYKLKQNKSLAPYWFHWIRNDPFRINSLMIRRGYDYVTCKDNIVPEGMIKNESGYYQYGDLVLMKCDLRQYLERRIETRKMSDRQLIATAQKFKTDAKASGADIEDELLDELIEGLGDTPRL